MSTTAAVLRRLTDVSSIGSNFFDVMFPVQFGDRYLAVTHDPLTGATLVDVYRHDRESNRLVVELFHGRPLPGAPPLTVKPAGGSGGVRLGVEGAGIVGYLSGGDDPRSIVVTPERIQILRGQDVTFEMLGSSIMGSPIGIVLSEDGINIGAPLPADFPSRRSFIGADVDIRDVIRGGPPVIAQTEFVDCLVIGPAVVAAMGPVNMTECVFPADATFVWELPAEDGIVHGVIGVAECEFLRCRFDHVGIAVQRGRVEDFLANIRHA